MAKLVSPNIFDIQAGSSFCKVSVVRFIDEANPLDSAPKVHFSFVKHSGKPACKQEAYIEAYLDVGGKDSCALFFASMITRGEAKKHRDTSLEAIKGTTNYPTPIFSNIGGTVAKRSTTGKAVFKQFSLSASEKNEYVLQALESEGEESSLGGITMKKGASATRINVPITRATLLALAEWIKIKISNEDLVFSMKNTEVWLNKEHTKYLETSIQPTKQVLVASPTAAPSPMHPQNIVIIYDCVGYMEGIKPENAIKVINEKIAEFCKSEDKLIADKNHYERVKELIESNNTGGSAIEFTGKVYNTKKNVLSVHVKSIL